MVRRRICYWEWTAPKEQLVMSRRSGPLLMAASCPPRSSGTGNWVAPTFLATKHLSCTGTKQAEAFLSWLNGCWPLSRGGIGAGHRAVDLPRPPAGAATGAAQIHREGPLPADKQADISPSETPAQGQRHKSRGGSTPARQPATAGRASFLPGPAALLPAAGARRELNLQLCI